MSVVSRLIVVHADARVVEAVRLGFARQGTDVVVIPPGPRGPLINGEPPQLVVVGAEGAEQARALLDGVRRDVEGAAQPVPILYLGNGISRDQALAAGASEYLPQPAFLRDVVTVGNLLASPRRAGALAGELGEHFGMYFLVRALLAVRRTGVLTLVRGLRRGEMRFYQGELTSAQVGVLHGQAAFHQLLLWTEGRFEFRTEQVVQRRQIPLEAADLLADAELFLSEIRTIAPGISPSTVFAQDVARAAAAAVPVQVAAVLGLFDGHRSVADVIEDSPYRVFETLRVSQRLAEIGAIRPAASARARTPARTALGIEEWLVGGPTPAANPRPDSEPPLAPRAGQPASPPGSSKKDRRKNKRRNGSGPRPVPGRAETPRVIVEPTDWSAILPASAGASDGIGMSPVVPSTMRSGEIDLPERRQPEVAEASVVVVADDPPAPPARERLEQLTDSDQRAKIFPAEPSVSTEADASDSAELRAAQDVARRALEQARAAADAAARAEEEAARAQRELARAQEDARKAAEEARKAFEAEDAAAEEDNWKSAVAAAKAAADEEDDWKKAVDAARHRAEDQTEPTEPIPREEIDASGVVGAEHPHSRSGEIAVSEPPAPSAPSPAEAPSIVIAMEPAPPPPPQMLAAPPPAPVVAAPPPPAPADVAATPPPPAGEGRVGAADIAHHHEVGRAAEEAAVLAAAAHVMPRRITPVPGAAPVDLAASSMSTKAAQVATQAASAVTFTDDDEAFFSAGRKLEQASAPPAESFTDLDDGYQPQGFWDRLRGKKPPAPASPTKAPPTKAPPAKGPPPKGPRRK